MTLHQTRTKRRSRWGSGDPSTDANERTCRWVTPGADINLRHNAPAALRVNHMGSIQCWLVTPVEGGFLVTEELVPGIYRDSYTIDTTFGGDVENWECDCSGFRDQGHRHLRHGCLHCRVVYAALEALGLVGEVEHQVTQRKAG